MSANLNLPSPEAVLDRPAQHTREVAVEKRLKIRKEVKELKAQIADLQGQLDNSTEEIPEWHKNCPPEDLENILARAKEREENSKNNIFTHLGKITIDENETVEATYGESVDYDLAGGYNILKRNHLSFKNGVYLLSTQTTFPKDHRAIRRDPLTPSWEQYILHPDLSKPLKVEAEGELEDLDSVDISESKPQEWQMIERALSKGLEAVRTRQLIDRVTSALDMSKLRPFVHPTGYTDELTFFTELEIPLGHEMSVRLAAILNKDIDRRAYPPKGYKALSRVEISFRHQEDIKEFYAIDVNTLEVRPHAYSSYDGVGNKHLHNDVEAVVNLGLSALVKNETDR